MLKFFIAFVMAMALFSDNVVAANLAGKNEVEEQEVNAAFQELECPYDNGTDFYYALEQTVKTNPVHYMAIYYESQCSQEIWIDLSAEIKVANKLTYEQGEDEKGRRMVYIYLQR